MGLEAQGPCIRRDGDDLVLLLKVIPGAASDEIVIDNDRIRVRITAPPIDGRANRYLKKFLGKSFGVPQSRVQIERGESHREKTVRIMRPSGLPAGLVPS